MRRHLPLTGGLTAVTAVTGSLANLGADQEWYDSLDKPWFTPPGAVFPVAWTTLYADIAVASARVLDRLPAAQRRAHLRALTLNLGLNASWSWTFFRAHRLPLASLHAALLAASSADLVRRSRAADPAAALALSAYAGWCGFATVLAGTIRRRNP